MSSKPVKVAVAGAGQLGLPIVKALLAANHPVLVLSRSTPKDLPKSDLLSVAQVDYTSKTSIEPHLKDVHTLVSTLGSLAIDAQGPLIDAAYAAGVSRVIPSEFGCDTHHHLAATLPVYAGKVAVQKQVEALAAKSEGKFSWTIIHNNAFLDSGLTNGFIANVPEKKLVRYDGGDVPFAATRLGVIADAIVGVLSNLGATKNKSLKIQDVRTTQNEILEILGGKDGWEIEEFDTKKDREDGFKELQEKGKDANFGKIMLGQIRGAAFAEGWGADFGERAPDNELVGIKEMGKGEWEEYVRSFAK
ncbi:uncharacterized protein AB675_6853 [Cyphellophora attinorum]|uniref:NmrA-like domain-containing protein n=1 Tax=Cyphellophora attinorum TaxID=1664694 RepID=A0A0N0NQ32_9EURO|nr:uncharacterized protein AB675_6853 [Phialophora attinorum]KPI43438.1 hypothetical protein AB675_6853 [Phialophora attinorum]